MSRVRTKCSLALVSRHSTAPGRGETFAKIWGMDDPLSKTLTTSQRRILPAHAAPYGISAPENNPSSGAQHLDRLPVEFLRQNQHSANHFAEAVTAWI